jgi:hypothetical protein
MATNTSPAGAGATPAAVGNPALFIAIELNGMNAFTGSMVITHGAATGSLFFAEGQVVHAETGAETGEGAFRRILGWPAGEHVLREGAVPAKRTITRTLDVLLAEARGARPSADTGARRTGLAGLAEQVRKVPGVVGAVLHTADGAPNGPGERSAIEDQALALARMGKGLGDLLKAGPIVLGVVHGSKRNLLLLTSREQQLTILIEAGEHAEAAQAQIRKLLSAPA